MNLKVVVWLSQIMLLQVLAAGVCKLNMNVKTLNMILFFHCY